MTQLVLIDADIVAYRCSASAENDPEEIALTRVEDLMCRIAHDTNASNYKAFLTGSNNYRYEIYPEYKANRKDKPKPRHLVACQEYLVKHWNAKITDGNEADDEMGIEQTHANLESTIATIDKDLLQVPGHHYDFVKGIQRFVSPYEGLRCFYRQIITGDGSDNIPSFDGKVRNTIPQFIARLLEPLEEMTTEEEMYYYCLGLYDNKDNDFNSTLAQEIMYRNASCLWIQRKENDRWQPPGQKDVDVAS